MEVTPLIIIIVKFGFQSESIRAAIKYETVKAFPLIECADRKQICILTQKNLS
jgi:hypothetical protein